LRASVLLLHIHGLAEQLRPSDEVLADGDVPLRGLGVELPLAEGTVDGGVLVLPRDQALVRPVLYQPVLPHER